MEQNENNEIQNINDNNKEEKFIDDIKQLMKKESCHKKKY